tara:strand:- start:635 stop:1543 length:909 start_codon:yes stop_codon:yes gene_type:complete
MYNNKMKNSKNNFYCIGALHYDYLLQLKNNIIKYRTNPILHKSKIGGVAYNVAKLISFFKKVEFYTLKVSSDLKSEVKDKNLKINNLNNINNERYYVAISNKKNKFLLGLANTDIYEKKLNLKFNKEIKNKYVIMDLNFSKNFLQKIINKISNTNKIIICATSVYKIYKIKSIIKKVNILFLNKDELIKLTNTKNIILGIKDILNRNNNITICVTNGKNNAILANKKKIYKIRPPKIKIKNENGAGDALAGMMIYLMSENYSLNNILKYSIACGSYYASGKSLKNMRDLQKIKNLSKKILIN